MRVGVESLFNDVMTEMAAHGDDRNALVYEIRRATVAQVVDSNALHPSFFRSFG